MQRGDRPGEGDAELLELPDVNTCRLVSCVTVTQHFKTQHNTTQFCAAELKFSETVITISPETSSRSAGGVPSLSPAEAVEAVRFVRT